jgi:hypothetical protein
MAFLFQEFEKLCIPDCLAEEIISFLRFQDKYVFTLPDGKVLASGHIAVRHGAVRQGEGPKTDGDVTLYDPCLGTSIGTFAAYNGPIDGYVLTEKFFYSQTRSGIVVHDRATGKRKCKVDGVYVNLRHVHKNVVFFTPEQSGKPSCIYDASLGEEAIVRTFFSHFSVFGEDVLLWDQNSSDDRQYRILGSDTLWTLHGQHPREVRAISLVHRWKNFERSARSLYFSRYKFCVHRWDGKLKCFFAESTHHLSADIQTCHELTAGEWLFETLSSKYWLYSVQECKLRLFKLSPKVYLNPLVPFCTLTDVEMLIWDEGCCYALSSSKHYEPKMRKLKQNAHLPKTPVEVVSSLTRIANGCIVSNGHVWQ